MYHFREFAAAGGLVSYGIDARIVYRQIGVYAGAILKGERPAELPVRMKIARTAVLPYDAGRDRHRPLRAD
jgi:ABC-type uncharacterized transport system substrate-binding protein